MNLDSSSRSLLVDCKSMFVWAISSGKVAERERKTESMVSRTRRIRVKSHSNDEYAFEIA